MQQPDELRLLKALGSLKLTLAALVLLAAVAVAFLWRDDVPGSVLAPPLGLLAVNLLAAIVTNASFRRQGALLAFHVALLTLVLLVAASRLTYLKGTLELADGSEFEGRLLEVDAGVLHPIENLQRLRFASLGFDIDYAPGPLRQGIRNRIELRPPGGVPSRMVITDHAPLAIEGYRFYPTGNKGFAPTFVWHPADGGEPRLGTVNLPSYPLHEHGQAREWTPPGTDLKIWTLLEFSEVILAPDRPSSFRPPKEHKLVLRIGERRRELLPGGAIDLAEGRLEYRGLRSWMGYAVFYDRTIPWLLAACVAAVLALGVHFWQKFAAKPWNPEAQQPQ